MAEEPSVPEAIEHVHHAHEALLETGNDKLRFVPVAAAVLAICAGLSGIVSGRLSEAVLSLKNEALLHEVSASDYWNEYQAESLKAHMYEVAVASYPANRSFRSQARKYRTEQPALLTKAHSEEALRDATLAQASSLEVRRGNLEVSLAFFEVAIVLTSIAAMIKRYSLFLLAGLVGVVGLFLGLRGAIGF